MLRLFILNFDLSRLHICLAPNYFGPYDDYCTGNTGTVTGELAINSLGLLTL